MFTNPAITTALVIAAIVAFVGVAPTAFAQHGASSSTAEELLICDRVADSAARLACINNLVDSLKRSPVSSPADSPSVPASIPEYPAVDNTSPTAMSPVVKVAPGPTTAVKKLPLPAVTPEASTMTVETELQESDAPESDAEIVHATIMRVWRTSDGRFAVELDNGQVWRETEGSRVGRPKAGKSVEISDGRFGGNRMKIESVPRIAWVRRTK
ncbi:MAG: hypothetical protein O3A13_10270 [Proteobacteria bacterium]|nr:hypothetical protein [Pseudomonadota bacterium]